MKYEMLCLPFTYNLCGKLTEATLILVPCLLQKNKEVWTLFSKANIINVWELIINRKRLINSSDCQSFVHTGTLNIFNKEKATKKIPTDFVFK